MMHGKVHVWYMTEEERLAYIEKYPIVPTGKTVFSTEAIDYEVTNERKKEAFKGKKIIDRVDKDNLHKLYMEGKTYPEIAKIININVNTLGNYIAELRKNDPDKWAIRTKK